MPEVAEVKQYAERLDEKLKNRVIARGTVLSGRYMRVDAGTLGLDRLIAARVVRVASKGKLIVFHFKTPQEEFCALSTLGMAGWWDADRVPYSPDIEKFKRIMLELADGGHAKFYDPRNFGTFKVVNTKEAQRKQAELGPDVLQNERWEDVKTVVLDRMQRFSKKATVAEALLDQRIFAGCGNYIRADAMYLASISPHRRTLNDKELGRLWEAVHEVAKTSYEAGGAYEPIVYGRRQTRFREEVQSFKDAGDRTVWWCPGKQS